MLINFCYVFFISFLIYLYWPWIWFLFYHFGNICYFSGLIARGKHWRPSLPRWLALNIITSWFVFYSLLILFVRGYWTLRCWSNCWERERTSRIQHIYFLMFFFIRIEMELIVWWFVEKNINISIHSLQ